MLFKTNSHFLVHSHLIVQVFFLLKFSLKTTKQPTFVVVKRLELLRNFNFTSQNGNVAWDSKIISLDLIFTHLSLCVGVYFTIFTSHYVLNLLLAQFTLFSPNLSHVLEAYCSLMFLTIWSGKTRSLKFFECKNI